MDAKKDLDLEYRMLVSKASRLVVELKAGDAAKRAQDELQQKELESAGWEGIKAAIQAEIPEALWGNIIWDPGSFDTLLAEMRAGQVLKGSDYPQGGWDVVLWMNECSPILIHLNHINKKGSEEDHWEIKAIQYAVATDYQLTEWNPGNPDATYLVGLGKWAQPPLYIWARDWRDYKAQDLMVVIARAMMQHDRLAEVKFNGWWDLMNEEHHAKHSKAVELEHKAKEILRRLDLEITEAEITERIKEMSGWQWDDFGAQVEIPLDSTDVLTRAQALLELAQDAELAQQQQQLTPEQKIQAALQEGIRELLRGEMREWLDLELDTRLGGGL